MNNKFAFQIIAKNIVSIQFYAMHCNKIKVVIHNCLSAVKLSTAVYLIRCLPACDNIAMIVSFVITLNIGCFMHASQLLSTCSFDLGCPSETLC